MLVQTQCMAQVALYRKVSVTNRQKEKKMSHTPSRASIRSTIHWLNEPPSHMPSSYFTRSHVPHEPPALWRHGWRHPPLPGLTRLTRFDPDLPGNLTRSEPPQKKKKKEKDREREKKCFDQVDPWPWPKSQNFQNGPVPLNFSSTFRLWDPFHHSKLRNCVNVQFPKVDFCTNIDQKVKIFKKYLSCPIFRVDSIFGVYFFIWEYEIAQ